MRAHELSRFRRDACEESSEGDERLYVEEEEEEEEEADDVLYELCRFDALLVREASVAPALSARWHQAIEATRQRVERQSVQVLAVLHDKDTRIAALEDELLRRPRSTRHCGVQTTELATKSTVDAALQTVDIQPPVRADVALQCDIKQLLPMAA
ncbi:hypothetical protein ATCC90586_011606 [Pythium insidiosum]|nr:hypothetical protein ATCC90586_011606 [Pythium insidiosum]